MQAITPSAEATIRATFADCPGDPDEAIAFAVIADNGEHYHCLAWLLESGDLSFDCFDNGKSGKLARWGSSIAAAITGAEPI